MRHILLLGVTVVALALAACGDKNSGTNVLECTATGETCTDDAGCCTGNCDDLTGICSRVAGQCLMADAECSTGPDCCSFSCVNFRCSGNQCTSDNAACSDDGECCSGICGDAGTCTPLNVACKTSGNTCGGNAECCSGLCSNGICNNAPSFCGQTGDTCSIDSECCGGYCMISNGAPLGICAVVPSSGASQCVNAGELCEKGADYDPTKDTLDQCGGECCSRACFPYGPNGVLVCQPASGCRPTGELCADDNDCCGGGTNPEANQAHVTCRKEPGFALGRCDQGNMCAPAGDICRLDTMQCNDTADCCGGNVHTIPTICRQDALGVPRCGGSGTIDCTDPASHVGQVCASSADCCGLPCTGSPEAGFFCQAGCQNTGSNCSTTADCCSGLPCNIAPGESTGTCGMMGTCSAYGQTCDATHPCCDSLTCNADGKCDAAIIL
jgi:hypothetical protein